MRKVLFIVTLCTCFNGCAAITPIMATVGAGASVTGAYYDIKGNEHITVISKECLFLGQYLPIRLAEEEKAGLLLPTKERFAGLNRAYKSNCKID